MPPTMAEREAELAALQSAFDEYIASSRELEEELDAELAKMRKFSWFLLITQLVYLAPIRSDGVIHFSWRSVFLVAIFVFQGHL